MNDWRESAACKGKDPELFYPSNGDRYCAKALVICAGCIVRLACLREALEFGPDEQGVWGGLLQHERRKLLRMRRAA
jgi:WhiB family redox-sensing transcriptional regulator